MEKIEIEEGNFHINIFIRAKGNKNPLAEWMEIHFNDESAMEFPIENFGELEKIVKKTHKYLRGKYAKTTLKKLFKIK